MTLRRRAWLELAGCVLFALPVRGARLVPQPQLRGVVLLAWPSSRTARWGSRYRWAIKGIYAAGLWLVVLGILSVMLRVLAFLFGGASEQEVPNLQIGHTEVDVVLNPWAEGGMVLDWLADNLALIMFVAMFFVIFLRLPRGLRDGRDGADFRAGGLGARRVRSTPWALRHRAAHVGRRRRRPRAGLDPHVHLHGLDPGTPGSATIMLHATEVLLKRVPGSPRARRHADGDDPGRSHRHRRRGGGHALADRPAADAGRPATTSAWRSAPSPRPARSGILIPPAIMLVVMAELLVTSAGALFVAATMPGLAAVGPLPALHHRGRHLRPGRAPRMPADYGPQTRTSSGALWRGLFPMTAADGDRHRLDLRRLGHADRERRASACSARS